MRHFLTLACVLVCFCVCGTLSAQAPKKKPARSAPAAKKHHATPVKHKPATKPRNNRAKAVAKDNSQVNAKKQIAKMAVVKDTVIVDETSRNGARNTGASSRAAGCVGRSIAAGTATSSYAPGDSRKTPAGPRAVAAS